MSRVDDGNGGSRGSDVWAITSYYNPIGYRRRRANFDQFRRRLNVPLIAVELAFGEEFELGQGDADILVQVRGGDVMWQKERLLNVAVAYLPAECSTVAWLDCDIIFDSDDWAERASRALDRYGIVQLFHEVAYLPPDLPASSIGPDGATWLRNGIAAAISAGEQPLAALQAFLRGYVPLYSRGFAWAARRSLIETCGLYDECIIGGGDSALVGAAVGCPDFATERQAMHDAQAKRYRAWGERFRDAVNGGVGAVDGTIFHQWHGAIEGRGHGKRHQGLNRFDFDPAADLRKTAGGSWHWNSEKREMHDFVRSYFVSRAEDG